MIPRASSRDSAPSRPASPVASLGVPIGAPVYAGASARTAHAPSADPGAGGDTAREAAAADAPLAADALGSDGGADLVAGGALLEAGLAQRTSLASDERAGDIVAPFAPDPGMPTDGSRVEAIDVPATTRAGSDDVDLTGIAERLSAGADETVGAAALPLDDEGLTADGPGPGAPSGDVEAGGDISDSVDEGAGIDGTNAPAEPAPADAGAQGADR